MRWIFIVVGLLLGTIVLIALIGAMLPKGHVDARLVRFKQPPERVFATITDFAQTHTWRKGVERVEMLPAQNGHTVFREHSYEPVTYRVELMEPPRRVVVRIADTHLPYGGAWIYEVAPLPDGGTQLTITERGEVYNPVFRFIRRFLMSQHRTLDDYLLALGTKLGEPATPEPGVAASAAP